MDIYKITKEFEIELYNNVISKIFPLMVASDKKVILDYLVKLINFIAVYFGFILENNETDTNNRFIKQLRKNEYKDSEELTMLLLPFINDPDFSNKERILKLEDIFSIKTKNIDINNSAPVYTFSNIQYNRCIRDGNIATERQFGYKDIEHNYQLLIETVIRMANRLFTNWSDILPYTLDEYKNDQLYRNTVDIFNKGNLDYINHIKYPDANMHKYSLYIGHIYDNIANNLFSNIFNYRWLIYDLLIDNNVIPVFTVLYNLFNFDLIDTDWDTQTDKFKHEFENGIVNMLEKNQTINTGSISINHENVRKIVKSLTFYFNKYYSDRHKIQFKKLEIDNDDLDDMIYKQSGLDYWKVLESIRSIEIKYIYDFIIESYKSYKGTWYWLFLTKNNLPIDVDTIRNKINELKYTPKNVYNFAKSLTHYTVETEFINYDSYWCMLNNENKIEIIKRLNDKFNSGWFNIKRYIRNLYNISSNAEADIHNTRIYMGIRNKLIDIVFETMIMNGGLTKFSPNIYLTDYENDKSKPYRERLKDSIKPDKYDTAFNFATNEQYSNNFIDIKKGNDITKIKYVEYMLTERADTSKIATLNWTSQILFYHKYINNRVILVTGGTGVGKSSQVPKLALYSLKTIDYRNTGNIICTQPTISSTMNGAKNMSNELGVQINAVLNSDDTRSTNFTIQYEYKDKQESHIRNTHDLMLKFCTDGILFKQVQNNPLMLQTFKKGLYSIISNKNIYDIIMIDESHTHNLNMDLILTLMKYSVHYNNSIKLFIISATMDDDEPYYRRFYRDINDNKMYPFNTILKEHMLDRVAVDRRYHVGTKLRYTVDELYKPDYNIFDAIREILRTSSDGDILIFQTGAMEINMAVSEINKITPPDVIALPLFSAMDSQEKDKIFEFHKYRHRIVSKKDSDFKKIDIGVSSPYNRFIIVATNVVEASITISSLRFVIDNGFYKSMKYDHKTFGTVTNDRTEISEQSRLQRKGRVGRVAPGTVYYLYEKGRKEQIRQDFNISSTDIHPILYALLVNDNEENIFNEKNNPQNLDNLDKRDINKIYSNGLNVFIRKHYYANNIFWNYKGNIDMYDYHNYTEPISFKSTGISSKYLSDNKGEFYIIHPEEVNFNRNILGNIINVSNDLTINNNTIFSKKIESFWKILKDYLFIFGTEEYYKTKYGERIFEIATLLSQFGFDDRFNYGLAVSYIYSIKYNCDKFLKVMAIYFTTSFQPNTIIDIKPSCYGDTGAILEFIEKLDNIGIDIEDNSPCINVFYDRTKRIIKNNIYIDNCEKIGYDFSKISNNINFPVDKYNDMDINFIKKYYNILIEIMTKLINLEQESNTISTLSSLLNVTQSNDKSYNYNLSLMHGFSYNLSINIGGKYQRLVELIPDNIYTIEQRSTLFKCPENYEYIIFFNVNPDSKQMNVIHGLHENDVLSLSHIFNIDYIRHKFAFLKTIDMPCYYSSLRILKQRIEKYYKASNIEKYRNIDDRDIFQNYLTKLILGLRHNGNFYVLAK